LTRILFRVTISIVSNINKINLLYSGGIQMTELKKGFTNFENLPLMLNVNDIAVLVRISRAGAYNLVNSDGFPKVKIGKRVLVPKSDLMQWLQQNKQ
jgi:excisionase family DNA binding protein